MASGSHGRFSTIGDPSGFVPIAPVRLDEDDAGPVADLGQEQLQADVPARDRQDPVRPAFDGVGQRDRGVPQRQAGRVAHDEMWRGTEPFWWNV